MNNICLDSGISCLTMMILVMNQRHDVKMFLMMRRSEQLVPPNVKTETFHMCITFGPDSGWSVLLSLDLHKDGECESMYRTGQVICPSQFCPLYGYLTFVMENFGTIALC